MSNNHYYQRKVIALSDNLNLVPLTSWLVAISCQYAAFLHWHKKLYSAHTGETFQIYKWASYPDGEPTLMEITEISEYWSTVFDYFRRMKDDAGVCEEMAAIAQFEGDVYVRAEDINYFSKMSGIGKEFEIAVKTNVEVSSDKSAAAKSENKKTRGSDRQEILSKAIKNAENPDDARSVFKALQKMAETHPPKPLLGYEVEGKDKYIVWETWDVDLHLKLTHLRT